MVSVQAWTCQAAGEPAVAGGAAFQQPRFEYRSQAVGVGAQPLDHAGGLRTGLEAAGVAQDVVCEAGADAGQALEECPGRRFADSEVWVFREPLRLVGRKDHAHAQPEAGEGEDGLHFRGR